MQLLTLHAGAVVALSALYLLGFGAIAVAGPARAFGYLQHFASTLRLHVLELLVRIAVGAAFVGYASQMHFGSLFYTFGGILVVTTLALAVIPLALAPADRSDLRPCGRAVPASHRNRVLRCGCIRALGPRSRGRGISRHTGVVAGAPRNLWRRLTIGCRGCGALHAFGRRERLARRPRTPDLWGVRRRRQQVINQGERACPGPTSLSCPPATWRRAERSSRRRSASP